LRGCGGLRRRELTGGCANGIPLKLSTPRRLVPMMVPDEKVTEGPPAAGAASPRGSICVIIIYSNFILTRVLKVIDEGIKRKFQELKSKTGRKKDTFM
jgi:hypothetical protein